jgi:5,10-methylenetetrahydromethanopterin reductase
VILAVVKLELLLLGDALAQLSERARFAESCGFDAVWLADERFYREVYGALAAIALATSRVAVGPCVTDPFTRHPALTVMAIATLDEISDGRAVPCQAWARAYPVSPNSASGPRSRRGRCERRSR